MNTVIKINKTNIFNDDLYLIDASDYCAVISSRHGMNALSRGDSFLDIIDTKTKDELFEWLSSFNTTPLKITTRIGEATVYNSIFPSTTLFVVQIKKENDACDISCLDIDALSNKNADKDILCKQALAISELCGCPIKLDSDRLDDDYAEDCTLSEFDFPLYTAFLINSLLLARRVAKERRAEIILETREKSPYVSVIFEPINDLYDTYAELSSISNIAEQLRIFFTRNASDGKLRITISPTRKNWALLGIKTPFEFTWDDEEPTA